MAGIPIVPVRGEGCQLWDADGKRYLDFLAGVAVNNLGHCHPKVVQGAAGAGSNPDPLLQLLPDPPADRAGRTALQPLLCRPGLFLQLRRRGERGGHQAGAEVQPGQYRPAGALRHHHCRRLLSRPDHGDRLRHRPGEGAALLRSAAARLLPCAVQRHRRHGSGGNRRNLRRHAGADPG